MAPNIESIPPAYWLVHRPRKGHFCHRVTKISGHSECEKGKTSSRATSFSDPKPDSLGPAGMGLVASLGD